MAERKNTSYAPNVDIPTSKKREGRGVIGAVLGLLLPVSIAEAVIGAPTVPTYVLWVTIAATLICVAILWRESIFRIRGRLVLSILGCVELVVLMVNLLPSDKIATELPIPVVPPAVTVAPADDSVTTLTNISQVLFQQQQEDAGNEVIYTNEDEQSEAHRAEQEAILNTTVYSVYSGAKFYHANTVCGTQSNRRSLTVREAMAEGMGACDKCHPPVYTG